MQIESISHGLKAFNGVCFCTSVPEIAYNGVTKPSHVDPELVGASGLGIESHSG